MIVTKVYQISAIILSIVLLVLSISYWLTSLELKERTLELQVAEAETKVLKLSNSSLSSSITRQSNAIRELEDKQRAKELVVAKTLNKIDTKYITKYEIVKDLNETAECQALKRIIDEEVNSSSITTNI